MDRLRVSANERVDIRDFRAGAGGDLTLAELLRLVRGLVLPGTRLAPGTQTGARILSGFTIPASAIGTATAMLQRGVGLLPLYDGGVTRFGVLAGEESPASIALDFSATGIGTYWVWVRIVQPDATQENRVFWNSNTADEFVNNVATRKVQTWEALFQLASASPPGHGEWVPVVQIGVSVPNVIGSIVDMRDLFFEGDPSMTYAQEWGDGANDRDVDRAAYGVADFHRFCALVRRQLTDIVGVKHYTLAPRSLLALALQHTIAGYHTNVIGDRILLIGDSTIGEPMFGLDPGTLLADQRVLALQAKGGAEAARGLFQFDRQGVLGRTNIMTESFLMASGDPETVGVPGKRWGKYFTVAAPGSATVGLPELDHDQIHGRKIRFLTQSGIAANVFSGIRTGGYSNGQAECGFWRVRNRPWILAAVVFPTPLVGNEVAEIGIVNDDAPIDSDASRVLIVISKAANGAFFEFRTPTGTWTHPVDLLGGAGVLHNTLYLVKIAIMANNRARALVIQPSYMAAEINMGANVLTEAPGGSLVSYSGFVVARNIAAMTDVTSVDCYRFDVGDLGYLGPI
jgi:hypothetical protein